MKLVTGNPYAGVNWLTDQRYKASLHAHTTQSDGNYTPAEVIDAYHALGYDILSLTDHDSREPGGAVTGNHPYTTWPWTDFGRDPDDLGMLAVQGNEPSWTHHIGSYLNDLWNQADIDEGRYAALQNSITGILGLIGDRGGIAQMAHPGREPLSDQLYVDLHVAYPNLNGHEVYNTGNKYPEDKPRWDRLLTLARASSLDLPLWGWSVDDSHGLIDLGLNYHVHLMPELTESAFRQSVTTGAFVFVYDPLGATPGRHLDAGNAPSVAPVVNSIAVRAASVTVYASQHNGIRWISEGTEVATGPTLDLATEGLGTYVRAELDGADGCITLTQPFWLEDGTPSTGFDIDSSTHPIQSLTAPGGGVTTVLESRTPNV